MSRYFISICDEKYLTVAEYLVKSLQEFSKNKIILYGINCDIPFNYPNLIKKRFDFDYSNIPNIALLKGKILSEDINSDNNEYIFMDADSISCPNIDELWDEFKNIKDCPISMRAPYHLCIFNGKNNPNDTLLTKYNLSINDKSFHYIQSSLILYNSNHKSFLNEWSDMCLDTNNHELYKKENFLHDETLLNILLMKYNSRVNIPLTMLNSYNFQDVKFIFENTVNIPEGGYIPVEGEMSQLYVRLPQDRNIVKSLHGTRDSNELEKIFNYLKGSKMKTGIIVTAYCNTKEKHNTLYNLVKQLQTIDNTFIVVASHTLVEERTQILCDYVIYDKNNVIDERKYSHGVAESMLMEEALLALKYYNIKNTYKLTFDCVLNDVSILETWKVPGYKMVSSWWGDVAMSTFAWYGEVDFVLKTFSFFKDIESMFKQSNTLEKIWAEDLIMWSVVNMVYLFNDFRRDMFGEKNTADLFYKNYEEKKLDRAFVTYFDIGFLETGKGLIQSLEMFSKHKIIAYTINFDMVEEYPNLIKRRLDVILNEDLIYEKPEVLLQSLNEVNEGIFLDADTIVNYNIDDIWKDLKNVNDIIGNRAQWEYCFYNGKQNPSKQLLELVNSPTKIKRSYCQTNVILYKNTETTKEFLNEWKILCKGTTTHSIEVRNNSFIVDESIFNALLNRSFKSFTKKRPYSCNATTLKDILYIDQYSVADDDPYDEIDNAFYPEQGKVDAYSMRIPLDRTEIKMFHGFKNKLEIDKTLEHLKNKYIKTLTIPFKQALIDVYSDIIKNVTTTIPLQNTTNTNVLQGLTEKNISFDYGARVTIGNSDKKHKIEFWDNDTDYLYYKTEIGKGQWSMPNPKYFVNWKIIVDGEETFFDLTNKEVFIRFDSKALGDNITWMPAVEKFRIKHNCKVHVFTFWNDMFRKAYPELNFVDDLNNPPQTYASYLIGCKDNDYNYNKRHWRVVPLHVIATDILGVDEENVKPKIDFTPGERPIKNKYIAICTESTMQSKFWNYKNGWEQLVDYVKHLGYDVIVTQKNKTNLKGVYDMSGKTIQDAANIIHHSEAFVCLGSGLAWLSWVINKEPIIIHGIEDNWYLQSKYQVTNKKVCNGCYHDITEEYDRSWNWCPRKKGFECTATITPKMVIEKLKECLGI